MTKNELKNQTPSSDYYPSKKEMGFIESLMTQAGQLMKRGRAIVPGNIARSDGFDIDKTIADLTKIVETQPGQSGLLSRLKSVSDLTGKLYDEFAQNPNSILNWYPTLEKAVAETDTFFKTPQTNMLRLPIELAQFMRLPYSETSAEDRQFFNEFLFDMLKLEDDKTYFIKTGTFSSKFQFANAKCSEPREMGEYFQVVNNFAMEIGAAHTVDLCVREYIQDPENLPTIYNGMPLRTEFRTFIDFDTNEIIGTVPYWHPIVMKRALSMQISPNMEQDYQTYLSQEDRLVEEFNASQSVLKRELQKLIPAIDLKGQYSLDIMKSGDDFYLIDMALMSESALSELLPEYTELAN